MFKHFLLWKKCLKLLLENTGKWPKAEELLIYLSILMQNPKAYNYHNLNYTYYLCCCYNSKYEIMILAGIGSGRPLQAECG